jgi:hypothetical protein
VALGDAVKGSVGSIHQCLHLVSLLGSSLLAPLGLFRVRLDSLKVGRSLVHRGVSRLDWDSELISELGSACRRRARASATVVRAGAGAAAGAPVAARVGGTVMPARVTRVVVVAMAAIGRAFTVTIVATITVTVVPAFTVAATGAHATAVTLTFAFTVASAVTVTVTITVTSAITVTFTGTAMGTIT